MGKLSRILAAGLFLLLLTGCAARTGWITRDGNTLYADENGEIVTGWQKIDGSTYFFSEDGIMVTGWQELDGKTCFFDSQGKLATGWLDDGGKTYYFLEDGTPTTGWFIDGDNQYFFSLDGAMETGWTEVEGNLLYFGVDGALATGRLELEEGNYLLDKDGLPLTGWQDTDLGRVYCGPDGMMVQGWAEIDDASYYFDDDGIMVTGHLELEGENYYFNPHGVQMLLVNPWNPLPEGYTVELETVEHFDIAAECADALQQMLDDCRAAGFYPAICSTYRTQEDQEFLFNRKVKNVMATGYSEEDAKILAAKEVAVPGTSEHQLGLAVDLVDDHYWVLDDRQAQRPTQQWLMEHCWDYGFILRYPVGSTDITGIVYEPWHYRYVGIEIAAELRELNITLEEYLGAADHS